jgi:hypothetical protein
VFVPGTKQLSNCGVRSVALKWAVFNNISLSIIPIGPHLALVPATPPPPC